MITALLLPLVLLQQPSEKEAFDHVMNSVRPLQAADGSYAGDADVTADVLIGMALSPRSYRVDDGPFTRDAVAWLLQRKEAVAADPARAARVAYALQLVHRDRYAPTVKELAAAAGVAPQPRALEGAFLDGTPDADPVALLTGLGEDAGLAETARALARAGIARRHAASAERGAPDAARVRAAYEEGCDFLLAARNDRGLWGFQGQVQAGITAIAARALLASERAEVRAAAEPALEYLVELQNDDGSMHDGRVAVYTTSVAIGLLEAADRPEHEEVIARAAGYLRAVQSDGGEGYSEADKFYGGIGYGGDLRPDLSNLQYALQALHEAGADAEDPAFEKALHFLQRTQNRSESNPGTYDNPDVEEPVRAGNDGGAAYYPGDSPAGYDHQPDGTVVARSYGSMTYALLKCYVFAGLERDDPRVQAAVDWIQNHWTLEVNPGFDTLRDPRAGFQGLYYYYQTLAEALDAAGIELLRAPDGEHRWRAELQRKLLEEQRDDGSWVNEEASRWWEGNPVLCTGYALNALRVSMDG